MVARRISKAAVIGMGMMGSQLAEILAAHKDRGGRRGRH